MTYDASLLSHTNSPSPPHFIYTGNGTCPPFTKISTITSSLLSILSVIFISNLFVNFLSISQFAQGC